MKLRKKLSFATLSVAGLIGMGFTDIIDMLKAVDMSVIIGIAYLISQGVSDIFEAKGFEGKAKAVEETYGKVKEAVKRAM